MGLKKIASFAADVYYYNQQRCEEAKDEVLEKAKITSKLNIIKMIKRQYCYMNKY